MPMDPSTVPALPVPMNTGNTPWPTFNLSAIERRAICNGQLTMVKLEGSAIAPAGVLQYVPLVGGSIQPGTNTTPASLLASPGVTPANPGLAIPPATTIIGTPVRSSNGNASVVPPIAAPAAGTPAPAPNVVTNLPPAASTAPGGLVRSSGTPPAPSVASFPPMAAATTSFSSPSSSSALGAPVRSSSVPPSSLSPTGPTSSPGISASPGSGQVMNVTSRRLPAPSPVTNDVVASRLGVAAFIFSLVSIIVLAIAVVIGPVRIAVMIIAILLSSLLAWILAIIAAKRPLISGRAKNLAGWGIILGTIAAIIEFIRIV